MRGVGLQPDEMGRRHTDPFGRLAEQVPAAFAWSFVFVIGVKLYILSTLLSNSMTYCGDLNNGLEASPLHRTMHDAVE
eukprot:SAG31_NODE_4760_length_2973_cov_3.074113_1_plen_78_part_00